MSQSPGGHLPSAFAEFPFADDELFQRRGRWREFFGHRIGQQFDGRVVFEIGCWDAAYLIRIAAKFPETGFIGIDWKRNSIREGADRITALGLRNVALLRGRAQDVARIFGDDELDEIWVFHPEPCERDVELKNRLIAPPFVADAHRTLRPGSSIHLKTDHPGYYQWVLGLFGERQPDWDAQRKVSRRHLMREQDIPPASDAVRERFDVTMQSADFWHDPAAIAHAASRPFAGETTAFERRFLTKRLPIYYFEMTKK